ncbi:hypothetical protein F5148DRAFT_1283710 [Russula earlei]|uniref:Uncharacterized protein n=1 Tax=Russula earlei TaxID=71964 RepID=A0ACC0UB50_9AGAM|nr:hypothetical protein F5148DRAFT_1283710 [Russula earlei]
MAQPKTQDHQDRVMSFDEPQQPALAHSSYSAQPSITDHHHNARQTTTRRNNQHKFLLEHLPRTCSTTSPYFNSGPMSRAIPEPQLEQPPSQVFLDFLASFDEPQHQHVLSHSSSSTQPSITDHRHARLPRTSSTSPYFNSGPMSGTIPTSYDPDLEPQLLPRGSEDFLASFDEPQRQPAAVSFSPYFNPGPVHDLQNYLQGCPAGSLTSYPGSHGHCLNPLTELKLITEKVFPSTQLQLWLPYVL